MQEWMFFLACSEYVMTNVGDWNVDYVLIVCMYVLFCKFYLFEFSIDAGSV